MSIRVLANGPQEFFRIAQFRPIDAPTYVAGSANPVPLPSEDWREQAIREMREEIGYIGYSSDPVSGRIGLGSWETLSPPLDPPPENPQTVVKDFLNRWRAFFGYGSEVLDTAELIENGVAPVYGTRILVWSQSLEGIPVYQGLLSTEMTSRGALLSISILMVPNPAMAADRGSGGDYHRVLESPPVSAPQAVAIAGHHLGEEITISDVEALDSEPKGDSRKQRFTADTLAGTVAASLTWLAGRDTLRLAWIVDITGRSSLGVPFRVLVDTQTGTVLARYTMAME
jgi:hypothetical protein